MNKCLRVAAGVFVIPVWLVLVGLFVGSAWAAMQMQLAVDFVIDDD